MFGNNFPIANQIGNGISNGVSNVGKALGKFQESTGAAAGAAAQSPLDAVGKFIDEKSADNDKIAHAFKQGVIPGIAETLQALSPGNNATDMLSALGIEMSPQMKSGLSAFINGGLNAALLPVALMDIADMMESGNEPSRITLWQNEIARPHTPPPPSSVRPGTRRPTGEVIACPPGYADGKPGAPKPDMSTMRGLQAMIAKLTAFLEQLQGMMSALDRVTSTPSDGGNQGADAAGPSPLDKLPKDAPFEDFVFALMMSIIKDQHAELKKLSESLAANKQVRDQAHEAAKAAKSIEGAQKAGLQVVTAVAGAAGPVNGAIVGMATQQAQSMTENRTADAEKKVEDAKEARQELVEKIKFEMQKLQELTTAMSNILNAMHDGAMGTIRNIK